VQRSAQGASFEGLRKHEPIDAVRTMFRIWGVDPSKYRPSSEALLRRIVKGGKLPRISTIVDIANLGAIETGWPYGCYDRAKISGPVEIRPGKAGEEYEGIGRQRLRLESRPLFADSEGPFGSPISDSTRTMITGSTRELLAIVCAPGNSSVLLLEEALSTLVERLANWCKASGLRKGIVESMSKGQS
jgi:DNA/RNA-binding domain of Phe-tRNA-synthetase-like protein